MNKIFGLILTFALCLAPVFAADGILISAKESAKEQRKVSEVGFRLLNANGIQTRAVFALATTRKINAYCDTRSRMIVIYRSLYERCETEDELAAILAHEIGHCETGAFYNPYSNLDIREKHERTANRWAVKKLVPKSELVTLLKKGYERWELAEHFEVTEDFINLAIRMYFEYGIAV